MKSLDPQWLTVELEAAKQQDWDTSLQQSYEIALKRVVSYQESRKNERLHVQSEDRGDIN